MHTDTGPGDPAWGRLINQAAQCGRQLSGPAPGAAARCAGCLGPVRAGCARCYQCALHAESAPGGLADLVVPVAYAPKGSPHARNLWLYKSGRDGAAAASAALTLLLLVFLREHGRCLWQRTGLRGPSHLAVVPSGRGRDGPHPLRSLVAPYLSVPWAALSARPGADRSRDLDPGRFTAARLPGAAVLLLDDTWTTGASAQSAAMSLRLGGARTVIVVVLGRHLAATAVNGPTAAALPVAALPAGAMALRPDVCAVHLGAPP